METQEKISSPPLPLTNSDPQIKIYSVLPVFGLINMIISSSTAIYRAYNKGDTAMIMFTSLVFVGTFLLDYCFRLYRELSPSEKSWERHMLKTGIWTLISAIMLGFAYEFSRFMSVVASVSLFGVVLSGNAFLFYLYFIWDGEGKNRHTQDSFCVGGEEENKQFLLTVDKV